MLALNTFSQKAAAAALALALSVASIGTTVQTPQTGQAHSQFAGAYVSVVA